MDVYFLDQVRSRCTHKKRPVVLIVIAGVPDKPVLVAYEDHDTLKTITPDARSPVLFLLYPSLGICDGILVFQLPRQRVIRGRSGASPAHGTVCFKVIRGIIIWVEICEVHVPA